MNGAAFTCVRWTVFVLNFICWLFGLVLIGVGLWVRLDPNVASYASFESGGGTNHFYALAYTFIVVGFVLTLLGFLGCCGAWRLSQGMLSAYFIVLFLVCVCEFLAAIFAWLYRDNIQQYVGDTMLTTILNNYGQQDHKALTRHVDQMQISLECCGVRSYEDWTNSYYAAEESVGPRPELGVGRYDRGRVPFSCCNKNGRSQFGNACGLQFDDMSPASYKPHIHTKGCVTSLASTLSYYSGVIITVAVVLCAIQLVSLILTVLLCIFILQERNRPIEKLGI